MKLKTWLMVLIFIICSLVNVQPVSAATIPSFVTGTPSLLLNNGDIDFGNSNYVSPSAITFEAWVYLPSLPTTLKVICGKAYSNNASYDLVWRPSSGGVTFTISNGTEYNAVAPLSLVEAGVWQYWAGTYNGSVIDIYLNGVLVGSTPCNINIAYNSSYSMYVGYYWTTGFLEEEVKDIAIWNYARSASQIAYDMETQPSSSSTGLIDYWPVDEGSGSNVNNLVSGGPNGSIQGTFSWVTPPAPSQPTISISAGMDSYPDIIYNWVSGATSEYLYRNGTQIATLSSTESVYEDRSISTPGTYQYYITATNAGGTTDSNTVSYTFNVNLTQSSPLGGIVSNNQLNLEWVPTQGATSYSIIDNGQPIVTGIPSTVTSYNLSSMQPGSNKLYLQTITATVYSASNIVDVDNVIPSKSLDYTFLAYNANKTGFISFFDGVFTKYLDNNSQNIILYPQNTTVCQSAS